MTVEQYRARAEADRVRESVYRAVALLRHGADGDARRAGDILTSTLALQDVDPASRTYGIWPYFFDQPLHAMPKPDWNWADFIGIRLAQILRCHANQLEAKLIERLRVALGHAAASIRRRDIGPDYTNIAIMGGVVTSAAGELLDDPSLLDYGRRRLRRIVEHADYHGGFTEYNSPHYIPVSMGTLDNALQILSDESSRADCEALRRVTWRIAAEHFHPATRQWAGPHARCYSERLGRDVAEYFSMQTGVPIDAHPRAVDLGVLPPIQDHLPCPEEFTQRFVAMPLRELEFRQRCIRRDDDEQSIWATTWMNDEACLGSVSRGDTNSQRRNLIAYWRTDDDPAVVLRTRFSVDGVDRGPVCLRIAQRGRRALVSLNPFDRPGESFDTEEMRFSVELIGQGTRGRQTASDRFELSAGHWRGIIHTPAGFVGDQPLTWELMQIASGWRVDALLYRGSRKNIVLKELGRVQLLAGFELLRDDEESGAISPEAGAADAPLRRDVWAVDPALTLFTPTEGEVFTPFPVLAY